MTIRELIDWHKERAQECLSRALVCAKKETGERNMRLNLFHETAVDMLVHCIELPLPDQHTIDDLDLAKEMLAEESAQIAANNAALGHGRVTMIWPDDFTDEDAGEALNRSQFFARLSANALEDYTYRWGLNKPA